MSFERIAVVGATGPAGIHLVRELSARGRMLVAVSRREDTLRGLFGDTGVEIRTADALDRQSTAAAITGCDLVIDCIGLPPERMADHPRTAAVITAAARAHGARCLLVSSYWSFFPQQGEVISESHPRHDGDEWFRLRREAEDIMLAAGAAVVHFPDFFGPHVHTGTVQLALEEAVAGKPVNWLGRPDYPREVSFIPDAVRIVSDLLEHEEAFGTNWGIPGNGAITANHLADVASAALARKVRVRAISGWLLRLLSLMHPELRKVRPMIPQYDRPVRYDTSRLRSLIGEVTTTPLDDAIEKTIEWLRP